MVPCRALLKPMAYILHLTNVAFLTFLTSSILYKIARLLLEELLCRRSAIPASEGYEAFYWLLHLPKIAWAGSKSARSVRNREQSIPMVRSWPDDAGRITQSRTNKCSTKNTCIDSWGEFITCRSSRVKVGQESIRISSAHLANRGSHYNNTIGE